MPVKKSEVEEKLKELAREAEEREAGRRAKKAGVLYLDAKTAPINIEALALLPEEMALKAKAAVVETNEQKAEATLAVVDPEEPAIKEAIQLLESKKYKPLIFCVSLSGLKHILNFYKYVPKEQEKITGAIKVEEERLIGLQKTLTSLEDVKGALQVANEENVYAGELLEIILAGALANRASDIHLEPEENSIKLRLRIDGLLHDVFSELKKNAYLYLLSRIKLLSELKLNVHDEPQDGRFSVKLPHKEGEVRVAVAPAEFGEVVVMRLLDPEAINLSLADLGLREDDLEIIEAELKKPNGMILNTGPTGSGKTTTLYAFLKHKKVPELKIITIEDPIEYQLPDIEQTQVDEEAGYTFRDGLKSLMRQDPDVILVGEIRDKETAGIAIQAALTGHLVFSTVHANEAAGVIPRLLDLEVRASSIGPALNLIIAQRLVRRLCENCKTPEKINPELKQKIEKFLSGLPKRLSREGYKEIKIYKAKGCEKCNNFGYGGRIGIYELALIGPEMEDLINKETNEAKLHEHAIRRGMITMQQDGILKTITGITAFEEVELITGPIGW
jgi:type II secretory ATPase GspE/PulE/Tfp pilus assembly ATPase PilB-like protein